MIPSILNDLPIHWQGTDSSTPDGCTLIATLVLGIPTTYVVRDGEVIGRVEVHRGSQSGYAGSGLKGGYYIGSGLFRNLAEKIAVRSGGRES